jgi:hypothetical protein
MPTSGHSSINCYLIRSLSASRIGRWVVSIIYTHALCLYLWVCWWIRRCWTINLKTSCALLDRVYLWSRAPGEEDISIWGHRQMPMNRIMMRVFIFTFNEIEPRAVCGLKAHSQITCKWEVNAQHLTNIFYIVSQGASRSLNFAFIITTPAQLVDNALIG